MKISIKTIIYLSLVAPTIAFSQESSNCSRQYSDKDVQNVQNRMDIMKIMAMNGRKYYDPNFTTDATKVFDDKKQYDNCLKEEKDREKYSSFRKYNDNIQSSSQAYPEGSVMADMMKNQQQMTKDYLGNTK